MEPTPCSDLGVSSGKYEDFSASSNILIMVGISSNDIHCMKPVRSSLHCRKGSMPINREVQETAVETVDGVEAVAVGAFGDVTVLDPEGTPVPSMTEVDMGVDTDADKEIRDAERDKERGHHDIPAMIEGAGETRFGESSSVVL